MIEIAAASIWWVYIVECQDGTYYTGVARDVTTRLARHNTGRGAKYTRGRGPVKLVYSEPQSDRSTALKREAEIKKLSRGEKQVLIDDFKKGAQKLT
ncbi:MAG TPA: GIY-YIG nuclease family protein [Vitreimonas sp.]|nr:GIY-YIG nuclease family protein [Vitreimonas sp.]